LGIGVTNFREGIGRNFGIEGTELRVYLLDFRLERNQVNWVALGLRN